MTEYKLTEEIISLSNATLWDAAKCEWSLSEVYEADEPERCLCDHFPIREVCILKNGVNGNVANVGNCCVKKFIGLPSDKIFQAVKRVRKDNGKALNGEAIDHAYRREWINKWEYDFSMNTLRKRKLTEKQLNTRRSINLKILSAMRKG